MAKFLRKGSGFIQMCVVLGAGGLGYSKAAIWWLIPLTLALAAFSWLTDHYWPLRFYDIYGAKDWARFWIETLIGLSCFTVMAFFVGRLVGALVIGT